MSISFFNILLFSNASIQNVLMQMCLNVLANAASLCHLSQSLKGQRCFLNDVDDGGGGAGGSCSAVARRTI